MYVQSYRGAMTSAMKFHVEASKEFNNDVCVLHCGTNDLKTDKSPEYIANNILEIDTQLEFEKNEVYISSILTRRDELKDKGEIIIYTLIVIIIC